MSLEEFVKVNLYLVRESSHTEVCDLYDFERVNVHIEEPVYFSSKANAETYKNERTKELIDKGYIEFEPGEFYFRRDDTSMHNLSIDAKQFRKESIIHTDNKFYYFDKSDKKMYEVHDKIIDMKVKVKIEDGG